MFSPSSGSTPWSPNWTYSYVAKLSIFIPLFFFPFPFLPSHALANQQFSLFPQPPLVLSNYAGDIMLQALLTRCITKLKRKTSKEAQFHPLTTTKSSSISLSLARALLDAPLPWMRTKKKKTILQAPTTPNSPTQATHTPLSSPLPKPTPLTSPTTRSPPSQHFFSMERPR